MPQPLFLSPIKEMGQLIVQRLKALPFWWSYILIGALLALIAASLILLEADRRKSVLGPGLLKELTFIGEDNLSNLSAVENLMSMGKRHYYLNYGSKSGLESVLPGVTIKVLGPPNLKQSQEVKTQRREDEDEFWHLQAMANKFVIRKQSNLFPKAAQYSPVGAPPFTRWFLKKMRTIRGEQLLGIVRTLDKVMNNTSLSLLFQVGQTKLLFPGDAQIENWSYALSKKANLKLLESVNVYKVGHHGSLNATPKTLWNGFKHKSTKKNSGRLKTFLSTMSGKHGKTTSKTEVPRRTLVDALTKESDLFNTQDLKSKKVIKLEDTINF